MTIAMKEVGRVVEMMKIEICVFQASIFVYYLFSPSVLHITVSPEVIFLCSVALNFPLFCFLSTSPSPSSHLVVSIFFVADLDPPSFKTRFPVAS